MMDYSGNGSHELIILSCWVKAKAYKTGYKRGLTGLLIQLLGCTHSQMHFAGCHRGSITFSSTKANRTYALIS